MVNVTYFVNTIQLCSLSLIILYISQLIIIVDRRRERFLFSFLDLFPHLLLRLSLNLLLFQVSNEIRVKTVLQNWNRARSFLVGVFISLDVRLSTRLFLLLSSTKRWNYVIARDSLSIVSCYFSIINYLVQVSHSARKEDDRSSTRITRSWIIRRIARAMLLLNILYFIYDISIDYDKWRQRTTKTYY